MADKTSWHRYGTKLRRCHPMYTNEQLRLPSEQLQPSSIPGPSSCSDHTCHINHTHSALQIYVNQRDFREDNYQTELPIPEAILIPFYPLNIFHQKIYISTINALVHSVLWCCWFGSRKGIWPVKNWVVGCWRGYLRGARCRLAYGPADATATHCLLLQ